MTTSKILACSALLAVAVVSAGCGDDESGSPTSPSGFTTVPADATLMPPTPDSPAEDAQLDTQRPTVTVNNGTSNVPGTLPKTYEFQIADEPTFSPSSASFITAFRVLASGTGIAEGANGKTSFTPPSDLQPATKYYWRARYVQIGQASPWSAVRTFRSKLSGYIRPGELYDPLLQGETVGNKVGNVVFIDGVGAQLQTPDSRITYNLPETISDGEYSMEVTGFDEGSTGDKSKIMSMQEGGGDITTNDYRYTVEYRGANYGGTPGTVAWRVITGDSSEEAGCISDGVRVQVPTTDSETYFWKTTWGSGVANLEIRLGNQSGAQLFAQSIGLNCRPYRPVPHVAHVGAPPGRGSILDATLSGMIARNVWLGNKPRPVSLGSAFRR